MQSLLRFREEGRSIQTTVWPAHFIQHQQITLSVCPSSSFVSKGTERTSVGTGVRTRTDIR